MTSSLSSEKVDKDNIFLGIASDGLMHIFINGEPVGSGIARGGGDDVFGYVDENNIVVLSGNLPSGDYTIKYEMEDGSLVDIGDLALDNNTYCSVTNNLTNCTNDNNTLSVVKGGSYTATITADSGYEISSLIITMGGNNITASVVTGNIITISNVTGNIVITAVAEQIPADYTNILDVYDITYNKRWSKSSNSYSAQNGMIAIAVPWSDVLNKTIRMKGFVSGQTSSGKGASWYVYNGNTCVGMLMGGAGNGIVWNATYLVDEGNGVYAIPINATSFDKITNGTTLYINLAVKDNVSVSASDIKDCIITIDEPIV